LFEEGGAKKEPGTKTTSAWRNYTIEKTCRREAFRKIETEQGRIEGAGTNKINGVYKRLLINA
jgi:hypothetical protein